MWNRLLSLAYIDIYERDLFFSFSICCCYCFVRSGLFFLFWVHCCYLACFFGDSFVLLFSSRHYTNTRFVLVLLLLFSVYISCVRVSMGIGLNKETENGVYKIYLRAIRSSCMLSVNQIFLILPNRYILF